MKVVFDIGNVMLNWDPQAVVTSLAVCDATRQMLQQHLFSHPDWLALDKGLLTETEVMQRVVKETRLTEQEINDCLQAGRHSLIEIEQSVELIYEIHEHNIPLYCLSNMSVETYNHVKDKPFFNLFSGIIISGHEKTIKPESDIFHLLLKRFDLNAAELLFIDDSLANIHAAHALGINTIVFDRTRLCYELIRGKLGLNTPA